MSNLTITGAPEVRTFTSEGLDTLRVLDLDGEPYFVAADVCAALGLSNVSASLKALDPDERAKKLLGHREFNLVSESGLYALVMRSNKPQAKAFRKWVTSEVLPSLRRTGRYATPAQEESDALAMARGLVAAQRTIEAMRTEMEQLQPVRSLVEAEGTFTIRFAARCVRKLCPDVRMRDCFTWLRERCYMAKRSKAPTQKGIDRGVLVPVLSTYRAEDGTEKACQPYSRITAKGIAEMVGHFSAGSQLALKV